MKLNEIEVTYVCSYNNDGDWVRFIGGGIVMYADILEVFEDVDPKNMSVNILMGYVEGDEYVVSVKDCCNIQIAEFTVTNERNVYGNWSQDMTENIEEELEKLINKK